ncbi:MAG: chemotaxis protein CheW [Bacteriovoracaceae bacterium]|nr:chemotaxis protein CheW [Bacteriovoracaceae bacterium]
MFDEKKEVNNIEKYLLFELGKELYAIELLEVKEVITPPETTPIPKCQPYVCGLMNLRGLVLTIVDLRKKLNITQGPITPENAVIIFDLKNRLVGGVVDSIVKVINLKKDAIKPVPDDNTTGHHLKGVIEHENTLCLLIDANKMFESVPQKKAA